MYTLACKDFGISCEFVAKDETIEGVVMKLYEHSRAYHYDALETTLAKMKEMSEGSAMSMLLSKIKRE